MQVEVRALIVLGDSVVVSREMRHGRPCMSLPGGRVKRDEVVVDALRREVREETGLEIEIGDLIYAAEIFRKHHLHDLNLIFGARPVEAPNVKELALVPIDSAAAREVLPPILDVVDRGRREPATATTRWLGNRWRPPSEDA